MRYRRALALLGASAAILFTACKEPPFAPRWDADWYVPLSFQTIPVPVGTIPNGAPPIADSFPNGPLSQDMSGVLGTVTKNLVTDPARCSAPTNPNLSCDLVTVTISKTLALTVQDTLFIGNAANVLNAAGQAAGTILLPVALSGAQQSLTDSLYLSPTQVSMLQAVGSSEGQLWIQVRGVLSNQSGSTITTTSADAIGITSLTATMRIAISHN